MAVKEKTPKTRAHRTSKHQHGAGGKGAPLTDLQKILIGNGGMAHKYLRANQSRLGSAPKRRGGRNAQDN